MSIGGAGGLGSVGVTSWFFLTSRRAINARAEARVAQAEAKLAEEKKKLAEEQRITAERAATIAEERARRAARQSRPDPTEARGGLARMMRETESALLSKISQLEAGLTTQERDFKEHKSKLAEYVERQGDKWDEVIKSIARLEGRLERDERDR